jgi:hypothetical protein
MGARWQWQNITIDIRALVLMNVIKKGVIRHFSPSGIFNTISLDIQENTNINVRSRGADSRLYDWIVCVSMRPHIRMIVLFHVRWKDVVRPSKDNPILKFMREVITVISPMDAISKDARWHLRQAVSGSFINEHILERPHIHVTWKDVVENSSNRGSSRHICFDMKKRSPFNVIMMDVIMRLCAVILSPHTSDSIRKNVRSNVKRKDVGGHSREKNNSNYIDVLIIMIKDIHVK